MERHYLILLAFAGGFFVLQFHSFLKEREMKEQEYRLYTKIEQARREGYQEAKRDFERKLREQGTRAIEKEPEPTRIESKTPTTWESIWKPPVIQEEPKTSKNKNILDDWIV